MSTRAEPHLTPFGGARVLDALPALPGGPQLAELGAHREDLALVGGAVRDLLLGRVPRELDVVVGEGAQQLAQKLASSLNTLAGESPDERFESTYHERFHTAIVHGRGAQIDIATRRKEIYSRPGALPEVDDGSVDQDLARRDFTVNAIAVPLGGSQRGQLQSVRHALEDLAARRLRVLHDASFLEDPTRLLRLARYSARLGFQAEPHTAALAGQALRAGALATVSRARIGAELRLALAEADAVGALRALADLGVLTALEPAIDFDDRLAKRALTLLPTDGGPDPLNNGSPDLLLAGVLLLSLGAREGAEQAMFALLDGLEFKALDRERAIRTALGAPSIAPQLDGVRAASRINALLSTHTLEAVALGAAMSSSAVPAARDWLQRLRHVKPGIGGDDLLAAGIPSGPEIGSRLAAVLALKLDGQIAAGREAELRAALQVTP